MSIRRILIALFVVAAVSSSGCMSSCGGCLRDGRTIAVSNSDRVNINYVETGHNTAQVQLGNRIVQIDAQSVNVDGTKYPLDPAVKAIQIQRDLDSVTISGDGRVLVQQACKSIEASPQTVGRVGGVR